MRSDAEISRTGIAPGTHRLPDGRAVEVVEIAGGGLRARIATLGAAILNLWVPDVEGALADLALGHDALSGYVEDPAFLSVAIGPVAGRVGHAAVEIDGTRHQLDANDGVNTLHSGPTGLHAVVWDLVDRKPDRVVLEAERPDGAGGFPGPLRIRLAISLADGALRLDWHAEAERSTPVALTHHLYLHPDGHGAGTVRDLVVQSGAERFVVLGDGLVPTGEIAPVEGTPFDVRPPRRLGDILESGHRQIEIAEGLDHDLLLGFDGQRRLPLRPVATVQGATRRIEVSTTEPGVHLYAGGFLDVETGKDGARYGPFSGLAIETQPPPNATAHDAFPDTVLRPGGVFQSTTVFQFQTL